MAETVLAFVLDQLSIFLREEGRLLGGLRQEVQLISDELGHMRAFLGVAETKEEDADLRLQEWIKQVREAAYDTEDVLDEFVARFARHSVTGFRGSVRRIFNSIKTLRTRHKLAVQMQSMKARIKNISEGHQRYQLEFGVTTKVSGSPAAANNTTWRYSRDDALLVEEAELVGIDNPKQQLISQLLEGDDSQLKVVSVVGMGGLGKTTLVKKVHEDLDIRRHFPVRAFVTVSQPCNFQELLKDLTRQLHNDLKKPVPESIEAMTAFQLKLCVKNFLQQAGRYAIVFDDVWDVEFWNEIRFALPENGYGNRVMLTTRKADVASASCNKSQDYVYKMVPLSFEDSWTLFCNKIFKGNGCPAHLIDVAKGILGKCEGLPLAILAISGLWALKDFSIAEWEMVRHSLGGELEGSGMLDRVRKILSLSYNDLPCHLKTCLLYLSIYPEDYEIGCHRLVQLWSAERFLGKREGMTMKDVGYNYLRELVNRSLIQVTQSFYEGIPDTCRIHDLVREVVLSKSREQNMITITTGQYTKWPSEKVRRLVVHSSSNTTEQHQESQCYSFNHLRSFITIESMNPLISRTLLSEVLKSSRLLKVLDLSHEKTLEELPNEIFNLYRLRYLNLYRTGVKAVPKFIGKLRNLEYLDLRETKVKELPVEILKLKKLEHLMVYQKVDSSDDSQGYHGFKAPSKLGGLIALQSLDTIDASSGSVVVKEIGKLTQLRQLGISNLRREDGKVLCSSLATLTRLWELNIASIRNEAGDYEVMDLNHHDQQQHSLSSSMPSSFLQSLRMLVLHGPLEKMPKWIAHLQSLVRIDLRWSRLRVEEDPLEPLHHLPNLVRIIFCGSYQGEGLCFKAGGFPKLKELYLVKLEKLKWLKVEEGALPSLHELSLDRLPLLEELPLGIQHSRNLRKLYLSELSSQLMEKLENLNEETEDYRKIAHISEVVIELWTDEEGWRKHRLWGKMM
ncbi:disease resistance protein RPM1-like [Coffea arabica]|uniref:Disease resistance protein RPM1-like n=1 Tax=Coffea arabica TaxID=13443 RepID=A0A6P6TUD2_COFAR|nr:disease resistance protein RPM1-like [Coffea arabica]XP_027082013.1 disease resistance protein RPM1-like [Coffea arabica]XP_027082014.1 disease resistance protein RPM1-like [Coffea arabica]